MVILNSATKEWLGHHCSMIMLCLMYILLADRATAMVLLHFCQFIELPLEFKIYSLEESLLDVDLPTYARYCHYRTVMLTGQWEFVVKQKHTP